MEKVKFSIVGCGRIALRHAEQISKQGELCAVCDIDNNTLESFSLKYPKVALYNSIEELLEKDDLSQDVNVCTPNGNHAEHTIKALKKGKHVVCEKPMALKVNDCRMMIEESEKAQRYLFIVKQNRYNPPVMKLKEIVDSGALGKIYSSQMNCFWNRNERYYQESPWKGTCNLDGGILYTQFSHFIDIFQWLLGHVKNVKSFSGNFDHSNTIEFDDTLVSIVEFESGVIGTMNFTINSYEKNMEGSITVFGEWGTVKIGGQYLNVLEYKNIKDLALSSMENHQKSNDYGFYQGSMSNHDKVIKNVIDVIRDRANIAVNGFDGLQTVELIQNIYRSVK
jgi:UDP-N-acetyl-2-amino-2-deoxyglucuronate dehydrogenase